MWIPLVHFNPPWIEVVAILATAIALLPLYSWLYVGMPVRLKRLAEQGQLQEYLREHWRTLMWKDIVGVLLFAPLYEELLMRGPVVLLLQYRADKVIVLGVAFALNLVFTFLHRGAVLHDLPKTEHRIFAFGVGYVMCIACLTGLLSVAIVTHAIINFYFGHEWSRLKNLMDPTKKIENAKISVEVSGEVYSFGPAKPETSVGDDLNDET